MNRYRFKSGSSQRGAVLFVAIIFLVVISLLAITASWNSVLQERMTGGVRNRQMGMLGAESALRAGEVDLWHAIDRANYSQGCLPIRCDFTGGGTGNFCYKSSLVGDLSSVVQTFRTNPTWNNTVGRAFPNALATLPAALESAELASQPRYIIEELGEVTTGSGTLLKQGGASVMGGADNDRKIDGRGGSGGAVGMTRFRITARSQGGSEAVTRIVESTLEAYKPNSCNP